MKYHPLYLTLLLAAMLVACNQPAKPLPAAEGNTAQTEQVQPSFYDTTAARLSYEVATQRLNENGTISVLTDFEHRFNHDTSAKAKLVSVKNFILSVPFGDSVATKRKLDFGIGYHLEQGDSLFLTFNINHQDYPYTYASESKMSAEVSFDIETQPNTRFTDIRIASTLKKATGAHEILFAFDGLDALIVKEIK